MINYEKLKGIFKNKVRVTDAFLVFFLITGSTGYGMVIDKDFINEEGDGINLTAPGVDVTNNGVISGNGICGNLGNGISSSATSEDSTIGNIINNGIISGNISSEEGGFGNGISSSATSGSSTIGNITNYGTISGNSTTEFGTGYGNGISSSATSGSSTIGDITNYGTISGNDSYIFKVNELLGNGISSIPGSGDSIIGNIINNGIVSGNSLNTHTAGISSIAGRDGGTISIGNITNNGIISGNSIEKGGFGIYIKNGGGIGKTIKVGDIKNNGIIIGNGNSESHGISIWNENGGTGVSIESVANTGVISGNSSGIYSVSDNGENIIGSISNTGVISGNSSGSARGVEVKDSTNAKTIIGDVTNTGIISGNSSSSNPRGFGYGIFTSSKSTQPDSSKIGDVTNSGVISGSSIGGTGFGIYTGSTVGNESIGDVKNYGIIKGSTKPIEGTVSSLTNNGILAGQNIISANNKNGTEVIINADGTIKEVNTGTGGLNDTTDGYTVLNGTVDGKISVGENSYIVNTYISSTKLTDKNNIIINGVGIGKGALDVDDNTTIKNAVINGYETALTVNGTNKFEGENVIFNGGGLKNDIAVIKGDAGNNTLEILGNSIINGAVDLGVGNDNLLVSNGTQINGDLDGGTGTDKLQLGDGNLNTDHPLNNHDGNGDGKTDEGDYRGLAIYHEIKNFENIDVKGAVTLYETAKITGESEIKIGKDSSLNLRIDPTKKDSNGRIIGHALYTAGDKTITGAAHTGAVDEYKNADGGTLNIITNGLGVGGVIAMSGDGVGTTTLDPDKKVLYVRTDSIIHSATVHTEKNIVALSTGPTPQVGDIKVTVGQDLLDIINPPVDPEPPIDPEPPVNKYQPRYTQLNKIYKSLIADGDNINAIYPTTSITLLKQYLDYPVQSDITDMALGNLLTLLNEIYTASPYSFSSELSRESMGLYSDNIIDNPFKAGEKEWMVYGGLLHESADLKDRYYGKNYHGFDTTDKITNVKVDNKITGAYALGEYGIDSTLSVGGILGGSKNKSDISNGSKLDGNAFYLGGYFKKDIENLRVLGGIGYQFVDYDAKRRAGNMMQSFSYENNYDDNGLNLYLSGRYNYALGNDFYLVPKAKLSYTYIDQDSVNEGDKPLAMYVDSKSFDVFEGLIGVDLKKEFLHETGKSAIKAGVAYKRILSGYEDEYLTANMKNGSDFDLLVPNKVKNNYSVGLDYEYENQKGVLFNVNGSYSFDVKESNSVKDNSSTKNSKDGWTIGVGIGYRLPNF